MISLRRVSSIWKSGNGLMQQRQKRLVEQRLGQALLHVGSRFDAYERSSNVGNPHFMEHLDGKVSIPRWKLHWLYMMKRKVEIEGEKEERPRSDQLNWNYESELEAFAHRLKIEVHADDIRAAFTEPVIDFDSEEQIATSSVPNNEELFHAGLEFSLAFVRLYLRKAFPRMGRDCTESVISYLMSESLLSYLARNLGYPDLIQSPVFPITSNALYRCFLASIGTIISGPGGKMEAARFVQDFIIVNLIDKDIVHDIWKPKDPMHILVKELQGRNLPPPEVRLTKQSGLNTVTPVFFIGLFCNRKLLSESGAESIVKAETDAAKLALKDVYGVNIDRYPHLVDFFSDFEMKKNIESIEISVRIPPLLRNGEEEQPLGSQKAVQSSLPKT